MTSSLSALHEVDLEIQRLTGEIERIRREAEIEVETKEVTEAGKKKSVRFFTDLPDLESIKLPKGFERAPITVPYDPTKIEKRTKLEEELRESLVAKSRQDIAVAVNKIRRDMSSACDAFPTAAETDAARQVGLNGDKLRQQVLSDLVPSLVLRERHQAAK